jgi:hypothetical protein
MKLTFEREDIQELIAREAADILNVDQSRIDVDLGYGYGPIVCSIKRDNDDDLPVAQAYRSLAIEAAE